MKRTLENAIITEETVKDLGEKIAMMAVRKLAALSSGLLDNLYKGLICDYIHRDEFGYVYSNGYDVASNAMLFLWQFKGCKLGEFINYNGKKITILHACFRLLNRDLDHYRDEVRRNIEIDGYLTDKYTPVSNYSPNVSFKRYYELIEKLELTNDELSILEDLMSGKTFRTIANERNVSVTVIWNKRVNIQNRYFALYER